MKFFEKGELKVLWPFYLDALISPMLFFAPVFMIVYFMNLGFSLFQVGLLIAAAPLATLIFEIPTGAVADLYGRKFSVILGFFLEAILVLMLFFFTDFYIILLIFALMGFASTFSSGAKEAWVTDLVKEKAKVLKNYFVKSRSLDSFGLVISGLIGALFVKSFGVSIIWPIATVSFSISIIFLFFAKENYKKRKVKIRESFLGIKKQSKKAVSYSYKHPVLFYFIIGSMVLVFAGTFNAGISWIPFMQDLGFPDHAFGYMWSFMGLVGVVSPLVASKLYKIGHEKMFIVKSLTFWIVASLMIVFVKGLIFAFVIIGALEFFDHMRRPAGRMFFHRFIPTKIRATVGSVEAMAIALVAIIGLVLSGLAVDLIGPRYSIFLSGILMIPAVIVYYRIKKG